MTSEKEHRLPFRRVSGRMWADARFRKLSQLGKLGFTYLLTGPAVSSLCGVLVLGRGQIADDMGIEVSDVDAMLAELEKSGLIVVDRVNRLVWLPNAPKHQAPHNPNVVRSWRGIWYSLPDSPLLSKIHASLRGFAATWGAEYVTAFDDSCPVSESPEHDTGNDRGNDSPNDTPPDSGVVSTSTSDQDQEKDQQEQEEEDPAVAGAPSTPPLPFDDSSKKTEPSKTRPKKPADPPKAKTPHQQLIDHYVAEFTAARGKEPTITPTIGKGAKELLAACGGDLDRAKGYVTRCYEPGSYWRDRATLTDIGREPDRYGKGADKQSTNAPRGMTLQPSDGTSWLAKGEEHTARMMAAEETDDND